MSTLVTAARLVRVEWQQYFRIIRTTYPPINLFEDVSFSVDRVSLIESKAGNDPAYIKSVGNLSNVPPERMVGGQGASWVACRVHWRVLARCRRHTHCIDAIPVSLGRRTGGPNQES